MGKSIIRLDDGDAAYYLEWSSIVGAPITGGATLEEFRAYYRREYGEEGMRGLDDRLRRVGLKGTSSFDEDSVNEEIAHNRAGLGGTCITKAEIIAHYCRGEPLATGEIEA